MAPARKKLKGPSSFGLAIFWFVAAHCSGAKGCPGWVITWVPIIFFLALAFGPVWLSANLDGELVSKWLNGPLKRCVAKWVTDASLTQLDALAKSVSPSELIGNCLNKE